MSTAAAWAVVKQEEISNSLAAGTGGTIALTDSYSGKQFVGNSAGVVIRAGNIMSGWVTMGDRKKAECG